MRFDKLAYLSVASGTIAALIATIGAPVAAALLAALVISAGVSASSDATPLTIGLATVGLATALGSGRGIWLRFLLALA